MFQFKIKLEEASRDLQFETGNHSPKSANAPWQENPIEIGE